LIKTVYKRVTGVAEEGEPLERVAELEVERRGDVAALTEAVEPAVRLGHNVWPAAGFVDTEIRCLTELESGNAKKEVQPRVQA
jgi:hypothetical protein